MLQSLWVPGRWPVALRAAVCTGACVAGGWAAGDLAAGFLAVIGAFTSLYASDRPYLNRAAVLAGVALSLAAAVVAGIEAHRAPVLAAPVVALIAAAATFLSAALRIGPPGAYLIALACAAGTALPTAHLGPWRIGALVLAGGAFAWCVHMAGALFDPRGPERAAVRRAAEAVAAFCETPAGLHAVHARHAAALALHEAWAALVAFRPVAGRPDGVRAALRALALELHQLFAARVAAADPAAAQAVPAAARARAIAGEAAAVRRRPGRPAPGRVPLGPPAAGEALREALAPGAPARVAAVRVGAAALLAGYAAGAFGLERVYWSIAAAVLVLHQGLAWRRAVRRAGERIVGTGAGLVLAAGLIALRPAGLVLAAVMMALQAVTELTVTRRYALAVVFITCSALMVSSGGGHVADAGPLLLARGGDTVIGCLVGLIVHLSVSPGPPAAPIRRELERLRAAVRPVLDRLAAGEVALDEARRVRRDLQHRIFALDAAYDVEVSGPGPRRRGAEDLWPQVAAAERLGYRLLAACWAAETGAAAPADTAASVAEFETALAEL